MSNAKEKLSRIKDYLADLSVQWKTHAATEHSYRAALQSLLADLIPGVTVVNEPAHIACGAPDLLVRSNAATHAPVGYVETKDIDDGDLDGNGKNKEQFDRYKADLDNLVFTDYLDFRFYLRGTRSAASADGTNAAPSVEAVRIASIVGGNIVPAAESELERFAALVDFFGAAKPKPITSPTRLAALMAGKARLLARSISAALTADKEGTTPLAHQMEVFRRVLIHDLTPEAFADIYAQTITYGMFAARLHDQTPEDFSRVEAAQLLPKTNPLLRKLFLDLANDLDPTVEWIVDDLVALFAASDVAAILKDYGKSTEKTDPILHFYEDFLTAYNPTLRRQRGVWYTPDPVVNFIVRAIDALLRSAFGLANGIADCQKVPVKVKNDAAAKKKDKPFVTREMHRVQLLDLSTGTGTFITAAIRLVHAKFAGMQGLWQGYVRDNLLPRLNGFEILMASYAMAHLKIEQLLESTGYVPDSDERLRIFLTNSLEEYDENTGTLWAQALAREAQEANYIKRDCPVMVVMGNPPYSGVSSNNGRWITELVGDYKREPGTDQPLKERKQWLNDDYVKFVRLAEHYIERNGYGIVAYINNNGFIDNPTFRGMRWHLLQTFDEIYVLNLHGNSMKKETAPDGSKDENVFDIMVGTSINIFVKRGGVSTGLTGFTGLGTGKNPVDPVNPVEKLATVHYADLYGKREDKYAFLESHALGNVGFHVVTPTAPFYFFCPKDESGRAEYEKGFKLDELMPVQSMSVLTARDDLVVDFTRAGLYEKIVGFCDATKSDDEIRSRFWPGKKAGKYLPGDTRGWKLSDARKTVATLDHHQMISEIDYRPFDTRYIYYTKSMVDWPRENVMRHFRDGGNLGLNLIRISTRDNHCAVIATDKIVDKTLLSSKDNANVFPLYLYSENMGKVERRANFDAGIYGKICAAVRVGAVREDASNVAESRLAFYRAHELGKTWYDVIEPTEILSLKPVMVESVDPAADRRTAKEIFRKMQPARNTADGRVVRFTVRAAKKLLFHKEINLFELCASFGRLFAASRRAWSETAAEIPCHRKHPNIDAYHHYIAKAHFGGVLYYVRFTVREDVRSESGNEFHGTMVTRVCVYKAESAEQSLRAHAHGEGSALLKATDTGLSLRSHTHGESPVPFVDNKIALFLAAVNEGAKGSEEFGVKREDLREVGERAVDPEDVFNYIYGVLHTPSYRERYAEFLKVDFPRIPYPKDADEFRRIAGIGAELVSVHLLRSPKLSDMFASEATFPVAGSNRIEAVKRDDGRVYVNAKQYFDNVPEAAWNAYVGGYQPAQKWLKDRKGRTLTADDVLHYKSIVLALLETGRLTAML